MAVKIKLARLGKIREPFYRVVVADARTRRDGRAIELIGRYQPKAEPSLIDIDSERAQYWLGVGAQPTEAVEALLKVTGDWQRFKGLPGAEGTLKPQPEKTSKRSRYESVLAAIGGDDSDDGATTAKKKSTKKSTKAKTEKSDGNSGDKPDATAEESDDAKVEKSDEPKADTKAEKTEEPKAEEAKAEESDDKAAKADDGTAAKADEPKADESK